MNKKENILIHTLKTLLAIAGSILVFPLIPIIRLVFGKEEFQNIMNEVKQSEARKETKKNQQFDKQETKAINKEKADKEEKAAKAESMDKKEKTTSHDKADEEAKKEEAAKDTSHSAEKANKTSSSETKISIDKKEILEEIYPHFKNCVYAKMEELHIPQSIETERTIFNGMKEFCSQLEDDYEKMMKEQTIDETFIKKFVDLEKIKATETSYRTIKSILTVEMSDLFEGDYDKEKWDKILFRDSTNFKTLMIENAKRDFVDFTSNTDIDNVHSRNDLVKLYQKFANVYVIPKKEYFVDIMIAEDSAIKLQEVRYDVSNCLGIKSCDINKKAMAIACDDMFMYDLCSACYDYSRWGFSVEETFARGIPKDMIDLYEEQLGEESFTSGRFVIDNEAVQHELERIRGRDKEFEYNWDNLTMEDVKNMKSIMDRYDYDEDIYLPKLVENTTFVDDAKFDYKMQMLDRMDEWVDEPPYETEEGIEYDIDMEDYMEEMEEYRAMEDIIESNEKIAQENYSPEDIPPNVFVENFEIPTDIPDIDEYYDAMAQNYIEPEKCDYDYNYGSR